MIKNMTIRMTSDIMMEMIIIATLMVMTINMDTVTDIVMKT